MMMPGEPDPIVPRPAYGFSALRGRRVIVGIPGIGFRNDLRADDPVVQAGRTFVPVLTEQDYYRAEAERIEAFAALVPIERVWVEDAATPIASSISAMAELDGPPPKLPRSVREGGVLIGRRVVQRVPDGFVRNLRATTPLYRDTEGRVTVNVCGEAEWYLWATAGAVPDMSGVNAVDLWIE